MVIYSRQPNQTSRLWSNWATKKGGLNLDKNNEEIFATLLKLVKWRKKDSWPFSCFQSKIAFFTHYVIQAERKEVVSFRTCERMWYIWWTVVTVFKFKTMHKLQGTGSMMKLLYTSETNTKTMHSTVVMCC